MKWAFAACVAMVAGLVGCVDDVQRKVDGIVTDVALTTCDWRCDHGFCAEGQFCMCPFGGGWSDARPWCKTCYDPDSMDRGAPIAIPCK